MVSRRFFSQKVRFSSVLATNLYSCLALSRRRNGNCNEKIHLVSIDLSFVGSILHVSLLSTLLFDILEWRVRHERCIFPSPENERDGFGQQRFVRLTFTLHIKRIRSKRKTVLKRKNRWKHRRQVSHCSPGPIPMPIVINSELFVGYEATIAT